MIAEVYRTDPPTLLGALTEPEMLARYQQAVIDELGSLADRPLIGHLRRTSTCAARVAVEGFEAVARDDLAAADELLSDVLAVATWRGWELPLEPQGSRELALEDLPRGLMGADRSPDSARVWLLDGATIALARARTAGAAAPGERGHH
jgi:hypothetical protein